MRVKDGDRNEEIIKVLMGFMFWGHDMNTTGIYINHGFSILVFCHFEPDKIFVVGVLLCMVGCSAVSLAST